MLDERCEIPMETFRAFLDNVKRKVYDRTQHILALQHARENRRRLLGRLEDIACLRDAQATVQMLLNQNDYPRALECIETAQEVLGTELKGVVCFRSVLALPEPNFPSPPPSADT